MMQNNAHNTPTITLRALEPEDLDFLYTMENDQKIWDVGVTNVPYSKYVLRDYIANSKCDIYTDRQTRLVIENEDNKAIGIIDLVDFDPKHSRAEVGIVIKKAYRRHGYAQLAIRQITNYCKTILHLQQIYVIVAKSNDRAINLFKSLNFNHSATLRQWLMTEKGHEDACFFQLFL